MSLVSSNIKVNKSKKLLWILGLSYLSIPIVGWLFFSLWLNTHIIQDSGYLVLPLLEQINLISQTKLNSIVLLPPYALCFLLLGTSFQIFKTASPPLKWLAGFSMLVSLIAIPFASAIVYSTGIFFIMTISLIFSDFRIK